MKSIKVKIVNEIRERIIDVELCKSPSVACIQLAEFENGNIIYNNDIFVDVNGDLIRVWLDNGTILCGDIEKHSYNYLSKCIEESWIYIGNYNIKSSFENNLLYIDYLKRIL